MRVRETATKEGKDNISNTLQLPRTTKTKGTCTEVAAASIRGKETVAVNIRGKETVAVNITDRGMVVAANTRVAL